MDIVRALSPLRDGFKPLRHLVGLNLFLGNIQHLAARMVIQGEWSQLDGKERLHHVIVIWHNGLSDFAGKQLEVGTDWAEEGRAQDARGFSSIWGSSTPKHQQLQPLFFVLGFWVISVWTQLLSIHRLFSPTDPKLWQVVSQTSQILKTLRRTITRDFIFFAFCGTGDFKTALCRHL